jgi:hypothetical protein
MEERQRADHARQRSLMCSGRRPLRPFIRLRMLPRDRTGNPMYRMSGTLVRPMTNERRGRRVLQSNHHNHVPQYYPVGVLLGSHSCSALQTRHPVLPQTLPIILTCQPFRVNQMFPPHVRSSPMRMPAHLWTFQWSTTESLMYVQHPQACR